MTSTCITDRTHIVDLAHAQLLVLDDHPGARIQVLAGGLWLTEERNLEDRFAGVGQWLRLEASGRTVAEALGPSRIQLFEPSRRPRRAWALGLAGRWSRMDKLATRSLAALLSLLLGLGVPELLARALLAPADAVHADGVAHLARPSAAHSGGG